MALEYFLYTELYNNTLVDRSMTTFAPLPPDKGQILIDFLIPHTQPLYLYREDAGLIVGNDDATVEAYLTGTAPPPQPDDDVIQSEFTGYTATTDSRLFGIEGAVTGNTVDIVQNINDIIYLSGQTDTKLAITDFNGYSATTLNDINTRVYRSGDTMTGTLCTTVNLFASGAVTGSSVSASVLMTTPVLNASTSISAPQITGSTCITTPISCATTLMRAPVVCGGTCVISPITIGTSCVTSPITCATTRMQAPIITGSTCVQSPIVSAVSCLCSQGTTRLVGATTAASTLNVSGVTTLGSQICWVNPTTGGTLNDYGVKWDPITKRLRTIPTTGSTANVYCYADCRVIATNATETNATYITRTWSFPLGYYEYEYNAVFGNSSLNRCAVVCFLMDGVVVGYCNLMKTNDGTVVTTAYITQNNTLSAGNHTPSIVFREIGGGTASVYYAAMRIQKIAETAP